MAPARSKRQHKRSLMHKASDLRTHAVARQNLSRLTMRLKAAFASAGTMVHITFLGLKELTAQLSPEDMDTLSTRYRNFLRTGKKFPFSSQQVNAVQWGVRGVRKYGDCVDLAWHAASIEPGLLQVIGSASHAAARTISGPFYFGDSFFLHGVYKLQKPATTDLALRLPSSFKKTAGRDVLHTLGGKTEAFDAAEVSSSLVKLKVHFLCGRGWRLRIDPMRQLVLYERQKMGDETLDAANAQAAQATLIAVTNLLMRESCSELVRVVTFLVACCISSDSPILSCESMRGSACRLFYQLYV